MPPVKNVAVIGAGPSGAIAVDALMQEKAFEVIRVFERQEKAGGCWYVPLACPDQSIIFLTATGSREMMRRRRGLILTAWLRAQQMRHWRPLSSFQPGRQ